MYPPQTPTTAISLHALHTPTAAAFPELRYDSAAPKEGGVVGLFPNPLQGYPNFSTPYSAPYSAPPQVSLAHQVSEPELVGIRATAASLNSIASMI